MPLPREIQDALRAYDNNKGFWRRLPFFGRDQAAIRALRSLNDAEQMNLLKIYQCFIENLPKITQESYKVYQAVMAYLNSIDFGGIPGVINTLHFAKLLKPVNLDKLTQLQGSHFQLLENLLSQLSSCMLLNQTNFDDLAKHFEAVEGNIPEELSIIASAVDRLNGRCLNQENFNTILKKPSLAANIASALIVLDQSELLTDDNRSKIIDLAQQEDPAEKIENYMRELNAESDTPRSRSRTYTNDKFFTAPPLRTKSRTSLENLIDQSPSNRPGTL